LIKKLSIDPLSANVEYTRHDADVTCSTCSTSSTGVFERGEYLLQNSILHFVFKINQSSEIVLQKLEFEFKQTKNGLS